MFTIADRTIRQVRYRDKGTLTYRFTLHNGGALPVRGRLAPAAPAAAVPLRAGHRRHGSPGSRCRRVGRGPGAGAAHGGLRDPLGSRRVLSRAWTCDVAAGMLRDDVQVDLPEELHTGSPREAFCPGSTATSRPPG